MELDIYIPSIKTGIEYDGVFWHRSSKTKEREKKKYSLCEKEGIRLIRIKECSSDMAPWVDDRAYSICDGDADDYRNLQKLLQHVLDELDPESNFWTRTHPHSVYSSVRVDLERDRVAIREMYMQELKKDSLSELRPDIAAEWHPNKNGSLTPAMFKCGSSQKVWWKCSICDNEWEATISHRTHGTGCPMCYEMSRKKKL